mgnify:CR=1 FL=1
MDKYLELKEKFEANRDDENAVKNGGVYEEFVFILLLMIKGGKKMIFKTHGPDCICRRFRNGYGECTAGGGRFI